MILKTDQNEMRKIALKWIKDDELKVIELGCSNGNFAELLYKRGITNYLGIDIQSKKIIEARNRLPKMSFVRCDLCQNLDFLKRATTFVSFQSLEHIEEDLSIVKAIPYGAKVIISVPNSPYKGHVRWFEANGWEERFSKYIDIDKTITIQNPNKPTKRSFLFRGIRNGENK